MSQSNTWGILFLKNWLFHKTIFFQIQSLCKNQIWFDLNYILSFLSFQLFWALRKVDIQNYLTICQKSIFLRLVQTSKGAPPHHFVNYNQQKKNHLPNCPKCSAIEELIGLLQTLIIDNFTQLSKFWHNWESIGRVEVVLQSHDCCNKAVRQMHKWADS